MVSFACTPVVHVSPFNPHSLPFTISFLSLTLLFLRCCCCCSSSSASFSFSSLLSSSFPSCHLHCHPPHPLVVVCLLLLFFFLLLVVFVVIILLLPFVFFFFFFINVIIIFFFFFSSFFLFTFFFVFFSFSVFWFFFFSSFSCYDYCVCVTSALEAMVNFAYTGSVAIDRFNAQPLLIAASFLNLQTVRDACCNFFRDR